MLYYVHNSLELFERKQEILSASSILLHVYGKALVQIKFGNINYFPDCGCCRHERRCCPCLDCLTSNKYIISLSDINIIHGRKTFVLESEGRFDCFRIKRQTPCHWLLSRIYKKNYTSRPWLDKYWYWHRWDVKTFSNSDKDMVGWLTNATRPFLSDYLILWKSRGW